MNTIKLRNITKKFGQKTVLNDITLNFQKGKIYAITGPSGCGKSTLLNIIGLLEKPTSGSISVLNNVNVSPNSNKARKILRYDISYLFQNYALSDTDTVFYNLKIALLYSKIKDKKVAIADVLKKVGLEGYENFKVYTLSGGEQQRLAIARILLKPASIILADEPTGNLDSKNKNDILNIFWKLKNDNTTIILVTHDMEIANKCDEIIDLGQY